MAAAPATCNEFVDIIRESGILDEVVLGPFLDQHPELSNPRLLADAMFKSGIITRFQKEMLLQGMRRGYIIADKYVLLDQIGAGGMGKVYLCEHRVMRRRVAIKVLPTSFAKNQEYVDRFHREARAAAALDHPNIVRAFDVDRDEKIHFIVMEFVDGCSLQDKVNKEGALDIRTAVDYIAQAAAGLQHAHESKLVHRDIKPGNLLVDRKGIVKVLDMGLAMFFQEQGQSLTQQYDANAILGTADYLAPEQAMDSHGVDIRADIYSLGMTLFYLLTGKSPYGEEGTVAQKILWHQMRSPKSVRELRADVPEELAAVISKMLEKKRDDRYQTPADVVEALAPFASGNGAVKTRGTGKKATPTTSVQSTKTTIRSVGPDTLAEIDEEKPSKVRSGSESKGKRPKSGKGEKPKNDDVLDDDDDDDRGKSRSKGPRSSGKHKRAKEEAEGFWTPRNMILMGSTAGVFLLLAIGVIIWAAMRPGPTPPNPSVQTPIEKNDPPPVVKGEDKIPDAPPEEKKPEPPKVDPPKVDPPPKDKVVPKTETKETGKKETPPKEVIPKKPPPPPAKKAEPLKDFYPVATAAKTATLFYDVATYTDGDKKGVVYRQKWDFREPKDAKEVKEIKDLKDVFIIDTTTLQVGAIDGRLSKAKIQWTMPPPTKAMAFFRTTNTHIEYGELHGKIIWDQILPLTGLEKDTWSWQLPNGSVKNYSIVKFDTFKGQTIFKGSHRSVVVRSSIKTPEGEVVTMHTYAKGIGEVSRLQTFEKSGATPQVLVEAKVVEE